MKKKRFVLFVVFVCSIIAIDHKNTLASTTISTDVITGGSIGVGTTSPYAPLSVVGEAVATNFTATSTTATSTFAGGLVVGGGLGTNNGFNVFNNGSGSMMVGIGTSSPATALDVYSTGNPQFTTNRPFGSGLAVGLRIIGLSSTDNVAATFGTTLSFNLEDASTAIMSNTGHVANIWENASAPFRTAALSFQTLTSGASSASEKMRISGNGNVGMGTTSPYAKLSVTSTAVASTTLALRPVSAQTANILDVYSTGGVLTSVINSSGNWGIGTSTPTTRLHVSSGASATTTVTIGELGLTSSKSCVNMNRSDGTAASFYINPAGVMVVETNYCR